MGVFFTLTRSITIQEVTGCNPLIFLDEYILEPVYCPIIKAGTVNTRVTISKPVPAANRNKMIKATGICIANKNCKENLRTLARQYPKGILIMNVINVSNRIFIFEQKFKSELRKKLMMRKIQKPSPLERVWVRLPF